MAEIELCPECGVPSYITSEFLWLDSGVIVQRRDTKHRVVFLECENLDPLFAGIGEIIGHSIEPIVVESRRRGARDYVLQFVPEGFQEQLSEDISVLDTAISSQLTATRFMGFGLASLADLRYEGDEEDRVIIRVEDPFSVPLWCGTFAGGCEAIVGGEWRVEYKKVPDGYYELLAHRSRHRPEIEGEVSRKEYVYRPGNVDIKKCATCGGPAVFSRFRWQADRGLIGSAYTDRRISINGETGLQDVFDELEKELGEAIPRAVIEAQRRFIKTGFFSIEGLLSEADFRTQFAYRGLGDLSEFRMGATGLHVRLENPTLHHSVIGFAQALFEMAFNVDSVVDWEINTDGDLLVKVNPRG
ncbi:MAG: hypothetical protein JW854_04665 [Actinobacteria bacterium]|nr:hypothetical protein [Actinomycetota bacterium]